MITTKIVKRHDSEIAMIKLFRIASGFLQKKEKENDDDDDGGVVIFFFI